MALENPALNDQSFRRGVAEVPGARATGFTVAGTYLKTGLLLLLLVLAAAFGWSQVEITTVNGQQIGLVPDWVWLAFLVTFITGFAAIFAYKAVALLSVIYALSEGALLGVSSRYFDLRYDGIVSQAVLTTLAIFLVMLLLYSSRIIKVTSRYVVGVMSAMGALAMLYLVAWMLSLFGVHFTYLYTPTPLGIGICVLILILAALNLPINFEFIERAAKGGAPAFMEWYGAFGLMLALIWIYVQVLRLLALLKARG